MPYNKETHSYEPPIFEYHVLIRNDDYMVVSCVEDTGDPLRGYGSWDRFSGPWATADEAYESLAEVVLS